MNEKCFEKLVGRVTLSTYRSGMAITILHTGQTGVERGVDRAARFASFAIGGFCSFEGRDELGALPDEVLQSLMRCNQRGARSALRATLDTAHMLIIVVPELSSANELTGIMALRRQARALKIPHVLVDPKTTLSDVISQVRRLEQVSSEPLRVMITGPRETRWAGGQALGWRLMCEITMSDALAKAPPSFRVLVVDDHLDTAKTTCTLLRALGHDAQAAISGTQALALAESFHPQIGLFDIGLPDISGYELARKLRAQQSDPIYLAAITGWDQAQDAKLALDAGFDQHVIKPAGTELIQAIMGVASRELVLAG